MLCDAVKTSKSSNTCMQMKSISKFELHTYSISNIIPFPICLFCSAHHIYIHIFTSLLFSCPTFLPGDLHRPSVTGATGFSHQEQFAIRAPGGAKGHVLQCCGRRMESSEHGMYNMHFWPKISQKSSHQYLYPQFIDSIGQYHFIYHR